MIREGVLELFALYFLYIKNEQRLLKTDNEIDLLVNRDWDFE